jgi:hypothetical protein
MMRRLAAASVVAILTGSPLAAEEATLVCLSSGHTYQVGDYACIPGCHGKQRYARCEVVATKPSWTFVSDLCPVADTTPPVPAHVTLAPVETAMSPIAFVVDWTPVDPSVADMLEPRRPLRILAAGG